MKEWPKTVETIPGGDSGHTQEDEGSLADAESCKIRRRRKGKESTKMVESIYV